MNHNALDRRSFLKTSLLGGAALALPWSATRAWAGGGGFRTDTPAQSAAALKAALEANLVKTTSRVSLTTGEDRTDMAFQSLKPFA